MRTGLKQLPRPSARATRERQRSGSTARQTLLALSVALVPFGASCTNDYGKFDFSRESSAAPDARSDAPGSGGTASGGSGGANAGGSGGLASGGSLADGSIPSLDANTDEGGEPAGDATPSDAASQDALPSDATDTDFDATGAADARSDALPDVLLEVPVPPNCDALYGSAPGYVFCSETPTQCVVAVRTAGSHCEALCSSFGGTCLDADDNMNQPCVAANTADTCTTPRDTTICTCSR